MSVRKRTWTGSDGEVREAWVCDYTDAQGVRRLKTFRKKKDAETFEATARGEIKAGTHVPDSQSKTVAEAGDLWLAAAKKRLDAVTIEQYQQLLDLHIKPFIGRTKLSQLSAPAVRLFEEQLADDHPEMDPPQKKRSPAMIRKIVGALGSILGDAMDRGLVGRNVVRERSHNRKKKTKAEQKRKLKVGVDIPTPSEIRAMLAAAKPDWRPLLMTACLTGLRASELRALQWRHVDFKRNEICVRERADKYGRIDAPKSETSERNVPMTPELARTLAELKLQRGGKANDLVFGTRLGTVQNLKNIVTRGLQPTLIRAGVTIPMLDANGKQIRDKKGKPMVRAKYTGMHALRHFFASWCINRPADGGLGLPPKVVQERMGHSSIMLTMDRYGHLFPRGDDADELAAAEAALLG